MRLAFTITTLLAIGQCSCRRHNHRHQLSNLPPASGHCSAQGVCSGIAYLLFELRGIDVGQAHGITVPSARKGQGKAGGLNLLAPQRG